MSLLLLHAFAAKPQNNRRDQFFKPGPVLLLSVAPSGLFDLRGGQIPLGLEYILSRHHAVSVSAGIPLMYSLHDKINRIESDYNSDFNAKIEYKYYCFPGGKHAKQFYAGAQLFYRAQQYKVGRSFYEEITKYDDEIVTGYTHADVKRNTIGFGLVFGIPVKLGRHFYFDISTGVGIKSSNVTYSNVAVLYVEKHNHHSYGVPGVLGMDDDYNRIGVSNILYIPICVKLNYMAGKR